ncbi:uncharacterized protein LOC122069241 [Macadamia integrifolia]|uniref:uncharacterized protein LOC122069241 n=1 Tax=Macadamia integrifolia TaxID=60698 RepID=UPI001C4FB8B5|nr:uncharacterized protein LOC122069241 [Macadamia integrifolia]
MPLTRLVTEAFGVVTISLVFLLVLFGVLCILYSVYFQARIRRQGFAQLRYFNGPWIIRITLIFLAIWWCFGEIVRLSFLRQEKVLHFLTLKWQENACKFYILSNMGFTEPCLLLTLMFLLRASLQRRDSGTLSRRWNGKTASYILLCCIPMFVLQLIIILIGPRFNSDNFAWKIPHSFITAVVHHDDVAFCTYPLLSTIVLGLFVILVTVYLLWLGRRMAHSVINKGLRRRVYWLIFSVTSFLPVRVLLLGLSVLSRPEHVLFEAVVFLAFLVLLSCAGVGIIMLVYCPIVDSLALRVIRDLEARDRSDFNNDTASLVANQSLLEMGSVASVARNSDASTKRGSISFRTMVKDDASTEVFEELSLFSPDSHRLVTSPPGSPPLPGRPMLHP